MGKLKVFICEVDSEDESKMREIASFEVEEEEVGKLEKGKALDELEERTEKIGQEIKRKLLQMQWERIDKEVSEAYYEGCAPETVRYDGHCEVTIVSRSGRLKLNRQLVYHKERQEHVMPGNAFLPEHEGLIITRGVQEWACLLPGELPFTSAARLLGWQSGEDKLLSDTTCRNLVREHGSIIRAAEAAEVERLWQTENFLDLEPHLSERQPAQPRASWPAELNEAVEKVLQEENPQPPAGVKSCDWERVLERHRHNPSVSGEGLRRLGPEVGSDEILVTVDEVLTRQAKPGRFWEVRTACIMTAVGMRYLSGTGESFLQQLFILLLILGVGRHRSLLFIADGARWIRNFFVDYCSAAAHTQMILDWYHLRLKGYQLSSMICRGKLAKGKFLATLYYHLWRGHVPAAIHFLSNYRDQAKNLDKLDELIAYLQARQPFIPDYQARRRQQQYIGSGHVEKANDLIVARRQKHQGMHWSLDTSDGLAALKTLMLNQGWDLYWTQHQVLPLVVS